LRHLLVLLFSSGALLGLGLGLLLSLIRLLLSLLGLLLRVRGLLLSLLGLLGGGLLLFFYLSATVCLGLRLLLGFLSLLLRLITLLLSGRPLLRFGIGAPLSATRLILGLLSLCLSLSCALLIFLPFTINARLFLAANRSYSGFFGGLNGFASNGANGLFILIAAVVVFSLVEKHFGVFQNLWRVLRRLRIPCNPHRVASFQEV
jgi:hypothetical protein